MDLGILFLGFVSMIIISGCVWMAKIAMKQTEQMKKDDASPLIVVEAKLVKKWSVRNSATEKTSHYATFEFGNGDRQDFCIEWVDYLSFAEGYVGQLSFQGTRYKKFAKGHMT